MFYQNKTSENKSVIRSYHCCESKQLDHFLDTVLYMIGSGINHALMFGSFYIL